MDREQVANEIKALRAKAKAPKLKGFVEGLDDDVYRSTEGISQSDIKTLIKEPFKYFNNIVTEQTEAMIEGTLLHILLGEPHKLHDKFFITDCARITKEIKEEAGNRLIYKEEKLAILKECVDSLKFNMKKYLGIDLDSYDSEVSYFGEYEGHKAKGRADKISKDRKTIFDFKKTSCASHKEFTKQVCSLNYGIQEVFYRELMGANSFGWIAIETKPMVDKNGKHHFVFGCFEASEQLREHSKRLIDEGLKVLARKDEFNTPFYPSEFILNDLEFGASLVKEIEPPLWYLK